MNEPGMSEDEKAVRNKYANVFLEQKGQKFRIIQRMTMGRPTNLTSLCTTAAGAWRALAKKIS